MGFAWDVWGNGKTAVRGGFGLYHGLLDTLDYRLDQTAPFNTAESIKGIALSNLSITPGTPPPAGTKVSPSNVQPDIATPAVLTWSLRIEQEIAPRTTLTVGYVGSHSYHQIRFRRPQRAHAAVCVEWRRLLSEHCGCEHQPGEFDFVGFRGAALYNALEVDVRRTFANGFQLRGNYTYAKNLDDGSAWNTSVSGNTPAFVEFPLDPKLDWGPAATDVRQAASVNGSWELPFGSQRRFLNHASAPVNFAASGWTASGILTVQTGFPFSPQLGLQPAGQRRHAQPDSAQLESLV